ncbi:hypothetical protein KY284_007808 [Solanum tuberosum]|nr:hypothetical protein KY284_007808 [Solanum tuberosum]
MSSLTFHFLFFLLFCLSKCCAQGNVTDHLALISFKNAIISDPLNITASWNESSHFCSWIGITCGNKHRRVIWIVLNSSELVGSLSPAVGNLSFLRVLWLSRNSFTGQIPGEIGKLSRLRMLSLANNSFSGEIPRNISRCSNLNYIHFGDNNLNGSIPTELRSLNKLEKLVLLSNKLTGQVPAYLGNHSSLLVIALGDNQLHGKIPDIFGGLKHLVFLDFALNYFSGEIPMSIFNLSSLDTLQLIFNKLEGGLPSDVGFNLPSLKFFLLVGNQLIGKVPTSILNSTSIMEFGIDGNNFTGQVPAFGNQKDLYWLGLAGNHFGNGMLDDLKFMYSLQNCTSLEQLIMENNNLGGVLPRYIGNMPNLLRLSVGGNLIQGNIPTEILQLENLQVLGLEKNNFTGMIPESIGQLRQLSKLYFHHNKFSGEIPHSLGNLTRLIELDLGSNKLQGTVPSNLGSCKLLSLLYLNGNQLSGPIPKELFELSLIEFDLSNNHLTGYFPVGIGSGNLTGLINLIYMNHSYNNLSGEIPSSFGTLTSLRELYLGNNALQGAIPASLSSLSSIEYMDLSHNHFAGRIPKFLDELVSLKFLNLSYNDLEGEVPLKGAFRNMSAVSLVGNSELCGGIPEFKMPKCSDKVASRRRRLSHRLIIVMLIIGGLSAATTVALLIFLCARRKKRSTSLENSSLDMIPRVTYNSLYKETNGFSMSSMIGSGAFSSVYRGNLEENGKFVAIKVLKLQVRGASKSFLTECEALRHIKHRNLVKLLTSCSSIDNQGNEFKALIYEYMANGNLANWLHNRSTDGEENHEPKTLNMLQRLNVIIDVASALDYLHHQSGTPLTHCDIKPNNVLLDEDFVAHLGDFGLARFLPDAANMLSLSQSASSLNIRGTIGYVPPEYATGNTFSTYGDIYSYGILLLETFTGRSPSDEIFKDGLNLHDFVKRAIPEQVKDISDPKLVYDERGRLINNKTMECLTLIIRVGIACSVESAKDRMDIANVVNELNVIKDAFLRN